MGNVTNISLFYKSYIFPDATGKTVAGVDNFAFRLIDADGAESLSVGYFIITIFSGLTAVNLTDSSTMAIVKEEVPTVITLRGRNHRPGPTWFLVTAPPGNGTLYQYDPSTGGAGDPLVFDTYGTECVSLIAQIRLPACCLHPRCHALACCLEV